MQNTSQADQSTFSLAKLAEPVAVQPWLRNDCFPRRPESGEYGYKTGKLFNPCSQSALVDQIARDKSKKIDLVWTPEKSHLTPPEEVQFLFGAVKVRERSRLKSSRRASLLSVALWGAMFIFALLTSLKALFSLYTFYFVVFGLIPLVESSWGLRQLRRYTPAKMAARVSEARYWFWVGTFKSPWTWIILACIGVVGLLQVMSGFSQSSSSARSAIMLAGIVKDNVRYGEAWRLLTGTLLHANLMHFLFNFLALLGLGKLVEVIANRTYVPIVFITAALAGSLFSLWLLPTQTSVGASGGIMGLIGFLAVLSYFHRNLLPRAFLKALLISIVYVFVAGLVAFNVIDNPAHLGGLLAGAALGILFARNEHNQIPLSVPRTITLLGTLAMAGVIAVAALCAQRIIAG